MYGIKRFMEKHTHDDKAGRIAIRAVVLPAYAMYCGVDLAVGMVNGEVFFRSSKIRESSGSAKLVEIMRKIAIIIGVVIIFPLILVVGLGIAIVGIVCSVVNYRRVEVASTAERGTLTAPESAESDVPSVSQQQGNQLVETFVMRMTLYTVSEVQYLLYDNGIDHDLCSVLESDLMISEGRDKVIHEVTDVLQKLEEFERGTACTEKACVVQKRSIMYQQQMIADGNQLSNSISQEEKNVEGWNVVSYAYEKYPEFGRALDEVSKLAKIKLKPAVPGSEFESVKDVYDVPDKGKDGEGI